VDARERRRSRAGSKTTSAYVVEPPVDEETFAKGEARRI